VLFVGAVALLCLALSLVLRWQAAVPLIVMPWRRLPAPPVSPAR